MTKLFYGSFEKILRTYITPEITQRDLANALLLSPKIGVKLSKAEREEKKASEPAIDDAIISRICKMIRKVPPSILNEHLKSNAFENVEYCFLTEIISRIPIMKRPHLINGLVLLVEQDNEVSAEEKTYYREVAAKKELATFLTEIYMFAITGISAVMNANNKPKTTNLPIKNRFFCGRDALLETIWKSYQNGEHVQGLFGMGGVGKTQIALQYAYEHMDEYNVVWWINAENSLTIQNSISKFLILQGIFSDNKNVEISRKIFLDYFDSHDKWFLIYDNAEYGTQHDYNMLLSYFPQNVSNGNVLMTTRCKNAFENAAHLEILVWNEEDAVNFLEQRSSIRDKENAKKLAERMGYLPLALEYAAAYIRETPDMDYVAYEAKLNKFGIKVLDYRVGNQAYEKTVREAFHITLDKLIANADTDAIAEGIKQFLQISAFFSSEGFNIKILANFWENLPESIDHDFGIDITRTLKDLEFSYEEEVPNPLLFFLLGIEEEDIREVVSPFLTATNKDLPEPLKSIFQNELERDDLLRRVTRYALVKIDNQIMSMHHLIQDIIFDEMEEYDRKRYVEYAFSLFDYCRIPSKMFQPTKEMLILLSSLAPHVHAILHKCVQYKIYGTKRITDATFIAREYFIWMFYLTTDLYECKDVTEAFKKDVVPLENGINFYEEVSLDKSIYYAYTLYLAAPSYIAMEKYHLSLEHMIKAIKVANATILQLPDRPFGYDLEALRIAYEIYSNSMDILLSFPCGYPPELVFDMHAGAILVLQKLVAFDPEKHWELEREFLNKLSRHLAHYTQRCFMLKFRMPKIESAKKRCAFLHSQFGFYCPLKPAETEMSVSDMKFDIMQEKDSNYTIKNLLGKPWKTFAFAPNIRTFENMLNALLEMDTEQLNRIAKRNLHEAIWTLAYIMHRTDIMNKYRPNNL